MQSIVNFVEENINYGKNHVLMVIEEHKWYSEDLIDKINHCIHQNGSNNIIIIKTIEAFNDLSKYTIYKKTYIIKNIEIIYLY